MKTTFASLFGGGRLADIGALQAVCELIWDVELDGAIAEVGKQLGGKTYIQSVTDMDWNKVKSPDILWASPPCPNFSVAKHNATETEIDKALARSVVDAIATLQPKAFILENVEAYKNSASLKLIEEALFSLGYWISREVINSADVGVPQTRRRLILRAVKGGFVPSLTGKKKWVGWYEAIADLIPSLPESKLAQWQIDRLPEDLFPNVLVDSKNASRDATIRHELEPSMTITAEKMRRPASTPRALLISGTPNDNGATISLRHDDQPALTITKSSGDRQSIRALLDDCKVVSMTSRALARFQTMPDWYELPEKNTLACKLIGNGVPCLLAQEIIAPLMEAIAHLL